MPDLEVVGVVGKTDSVTAQVKQRAFDVAVLGVATGWVNVIASLRVTRPGSKIVLVRSETESPSLLAMIDAGVDASVDQDAHLTDLVTMVRRVHTGAVAFTSQE